MRSAFAPSTPAADRPASDQLPSVPAQTLLATLSLIAAVIHLVMVPDHTSESLALGLGFAAAGWFQLTFGIALLVRPARAWLVAGALGNVGFVSVWLLSRTTGLPFGLEGGVAQPAGAIDIVCALAEALVVLASVVFLKFPAFGRRVPGHTTRILQPAALLAAFIGLTVLLTVPGTREHAHAHQDHEVATGATGATGASDHASSPPGAAAHDHTAHVEHDEAEHGEHGEQAHGEQAHGEQAHDEPAHDDGHGHSNPLSTASWSLGATEREVTDTQEFIEKTRAAVSTFTSIDDAKAKGYVRINAEHMLNPYLLLDSKIMDPTAIESLIVGQRNGEDFIAGGMYLMNLKQTMKDVPRLGGPLLVWHSHGGFCFNQNVEIVGVDPATGACPTGATFVDDPPMTHIWSNPQPNADGKVRTDEACGVFVYLDLPHDRGVPGCSDESGGGLAHA